MTEKFSAGNCDDEITLNVVLLRWAGVQTRSRMTVVERQHGGRHCPLPAVQRKYCAYTECFQWMLGDWKSCQTEAGFAITSRGRCFALGFLLSRHTRSEFQYMQAIQFEYRI